MTTNLYQVLYVGPPRYEGNSSEQESLRQTVQFFIQTNGGRRSGLVGVKIGFSLGMFIIFTDSLLAAQCMPRSFDDFERQYDVLAVTDEKVRTAGPFFYEAKVF
jgi:hypothetical protein